MSCLMTKDEMKNRISLALKDPTLQQGFEIICKESMELKAIVDFQTSSNMDRYFQLKRNKERLAKAKDILKRLLEEEKNNMFWEMDGSDKSLYYKVRKEAEQFLKEEKK